MKRISGCGLVLAAALLSGAAGGTTTTYHVAPGGNDDPRGGSAERPWGSISFAVKRVPDGSTILVKPGTYNGRVGLERRFERGIVIRSQVPYRALLRHRERVIYCYGCAGITIEGFDVAHNGPGAGALVAQIDGRGDGSTKNIVIQNNILHDSYNNDILKVNNGARRVVIRGNIFYNQHGRDEHIDANSVEDVSIEDNVFFNDFAAVGRRPDENTGSFIVVKDSNEDEDQILGSRGIGIRRNVFLGWEGGRAYGFLLLGEDGKPYFEVQGAMVENNLFLGDSRVEMRSPFGIKGARAVTFRHNTIVGDMPGRAFATRINREGRNHAPDDIRFFNNVWADPTRTMSRLSDSEPEDVKSFALQNNCYWNGGAELPRGRGQAIEAAHDSRAVLADPGLPAVGQVVRPRWLAAQGRFADGSPTIEKVRERLIETHARPRSGSALIDRADPSQAAKEDIRRVPRTGKPDIGAYERDARPTRTASHL
jgi:hypothetical protein